ncbi:hypothetical protein [Stigmatella aurantiaca]|uniref:Conserved uncharacterized protein n=1 Tax=Stigmatella aurantiaca (strain DW4/3-1) TaxID=378806 RepID=Q08R65_STIAD|nr:hypothetical protein [Stigmatella aurantiaca]ADO74546.1 conserved uncharacterized protein [Stigmatella aurantiaca DW4/3-1]EAU62985.1 hypothetical protein STIAU_8190 [Stigmatella aurantiaca DW4/3-1]
MSPLPPCGLYRTRQALGSHISEGRLVYFHNHGDPGPGLYLPSGWSQNRAHWHTRGTTLPTPDWAEHLEPLPDEGFYRVREPFFCCEKRCQNFEEEQLVQLGYNGAAEPILFVPEWGAAGLTFPTTGTLVERARLDRLTALKVHPSEEERASGTGPLH